MEALPKHARFEWTSEMVQWLRDNYNRYRDEELALHLGCRKGGIRHKLDTLNLMRTPKAIAEGHHHRGQPSRLQPRQWAREEKQEIVIRHTPRGDKHPWIRFGMNKWQKLSHYTWTQAHGPIPEGYAIRFRDGRTDNCSLDNLFLVTKAENLLLNKRIAGIPERGQGITAREKAEARSKAFKQRQAQKKKAKAAETRKKHKATIEKEARKKAEQEAAKEARRLRREQERMEREEKRKGERQARREAYLQRKKGREARRYAQKREMTALRRAALDQKRQEREAARREAEARKAEAKKRKEAEVKWAAQGRNNRNREERKRMVLRAVDMTQLIPVRIDHKTTVYARPGQDIEEIRKRYTKTQAA